MELYQFGVRLLLVVIVSNFVLGSVDDIVPVSPGCTRRAPNGNDCSTVEADCFIPTVNGSSPVCDRDLDDNSRSCYRICITPNLPFAGTCEVDNVAFENNKLPQRAGSLRIFSPNFIDRKNYRKSTICRYKATCEPGQFLHYHITDHTLEEEVDCDGELECVDSLTLDCYGTQVTTCGAQHSRMDFKTFPPQLTVKFKTNRRIQDCGFNIMVTCVDSSAYFLPGCVSPDDPRKGRRDDSALYHWDEIFKVRARRGFRVPHITVPSDAVVQYVGFTVRVVRDGIWLYKFPNIRVFQVYNRAEGYQTFTGSGPPDRDFTGFGYLQIGRGVVHYVQEEISPELRPSPAEEKLIGNLQMRMMLEFTDENFDVVDDQDDSASLPNLPECSPREFNTSEELQLRTEALMYDNACNGVLAVTARSFQEIVMKIPWH